MTRIKHMLNETTNGVPITDVWLEAEPSHNGHIIPEDEWQEYIQFGKGLDNIGCLKLTIYRKTDHSEFHIGHFFLSPMPGCCGIVVSHGAFLTPENRHSGLRHAFRTIKPAIAKLLGYPMMIATTVTHDIPAMGSFLRSKYNIVETFENSRTGNTVAIGVKKI